MWPVWNLRSVPPHLVSVLEQILEGLVDGTISMDHVETRSGLGTHEIIVRFNNRTMAAKSAAPKATTWISAVPASTTISIGAGPTPSPLLDLGVIKEPVIGFRDFVLRTSIDGAILMSRNDHPWPYRKRMRALCASSNSGQPFSKHDAPRETCNCGIYAYARPDDPNLKDTDVVWGEIAMWGEVLICEKGYRSQFAYPLSLFLRDNGTRNVHFLSDELAELYGVPCFVVAEREGKTAQEVMGEMIENLYRQEEL